MTGNQNDGFDPAHAATHGYTKEDWDEVCDNPEWTEADFAAARPFAEVFPELAASIEREGLLMPDGARQQVAVPLDPDVIAKFKATGAGWEARINEVLRNAEP